MQLFIYASSPILKEHLGAEGSGGRGFGAVAVVAVAVPGAVVVAEAVLWQLRVVHPVYITTIITVNLD